VVSKPDLRVAVVNLRPIADDHSAGEGSRKLAGSCQLSKIVVTSNWKELARCMHKGVTGQIGLNRSCAAAEDSTSCRCSRSFKSVSCSNKSLCSCR
jgi:hypothetical protein